MRPVRRGLEFVETVYPFARISDPWHLEEFFVKLPESVGVHLKNRPNVVGSIEEPLEDACQTSSSIWRPDEQ